MPGSANTPHLLPGILKSSQLKILSLTASPRVPAFLSIRFSFLF